MDNNGLQILEWLAEMVDDVPLAETPINRFAESEAANKIASEKKALLSASMRNSPSGATLQDRVAAIRQAGAAKANAAKPTNRNDAVLPDETVIASAREIAQNADSLAALNSAMDQFEGCNLKPSAKNLVFADGNPNAPIMFVGEAPGSEEDSHGLPFVGRSGQLLDRMLAAIGLDREKVYISNVIPWRPPGNRTPTPAEVEICRPFIERHIELVKPKLLVMVGGSSAKMLLDTTDGILSLRGKWRKYSLNGEEVDAIAMLHPAYLLRQPAQKRLAWHDLQKIRAKLSEL